MTMRGLPLDGPGFAEIIDRNLLNADKTRFIHDMIMNPMPQGYLLRPRGFGKTLLLDTVKELFAGDRALFKDLWIGRGSGYDFPRHPVVSLRFSDQPGGPEAMKRMILEELDEAAAKADLDLEGDSPGDRLANLLKALSEKTGSPAVLLIDDYDAAVPAGVVRFWTAWNMTEALHRFLAVLRQDGVHQHLRLALIAGEARFVMSSMDGPRHLDDLSLRPKFGGACGFTLQEFDSLFAERLPGTLASLKETGQMEPSAAVSDLRAKIVEWYGGYRWGSPDRVLNPWSVLHFFSRRSFGEHWAGDGLPGRLKAPIRSKPFDWLEPRPGWCRSVWVDCWDPARPSPPQVLFGAGLLTLDEEGLIMVDYKSDLRDTGLLPAFSFREPNLEVARSYRLACLDLLFGPGSEADLKIKGEALREALAARDAERVGEVVGAAIAGAAHARRADTNWQLGSLLGLILLAMGFRSPNHWTGLGQGGVLSVRLDDWIRLVVEPRRRDYETWRALDAENELVTDAMAAALPPERFHRCLSDWLEIRFGSGLDVSTVFPPGDQSRWPAGYRSLVEALRRQQLTRQAIGSALAELAEYELSPEALMAARRQAPPVTADIPLERIDQKLAGDLQEALAALEEKVGAIRAEGEDRGVVGLALAVYGHGTRVKAAFGPAGPRALAKPSA